MKKLFLRIYLGTLLALFFGLVVAEQITTWAYDDLEGDSHSEYIAIVHPLIADALEGSPPGEWRSVLDKWEGITEYELSLATNGDSADSADLPNPQDSLPNEPKSPVASNGASRL